MFVESFLTVNTFVFCWPFISNTEVGVVVLIEIPDDVPYKYAVVVSACETKILLFIPNISPSMLFCNGSPCPKNNLRFT